MLKELFKKQAELNKRTGFDPEALREAFDPQTAGIWLNNYWIRYLPLANWASRTCQLYEKKGA